MRSERRKEVRQVPRFTVYLAFQYHHARGCCSSRSFCNALQRRVGSSCDCRLVLPTTCCLVCFFFLSFQTMKVGLALQASQGMVCWCLSVANFCILIALIPVLESWKSLSLGKARVKGSHNSYGEWINKPLLWLEGTEDSLHQPAITVHTEGHVQGVWKSSRMENP